MFQTDVAIADKVGYNDCINRPTEKKNAVSTCIVLVQNDVPPETYRNWAPPHRDACADNASRQSMPRFEWLQYAARPTRSFPILHNSYITKPNKTCFSQHFFVQLPDPTWHSGQRALKRSLLDDSRAVANAHWRAKICPGSAPKWCEKSEQSMFKTPKNRLQKKKHNVVPLLLRFVFKTLKVVSKEHVFQQH